MNNPPSSPPQFNFGAQAADHRPPSPSNNELLPAFDNKNLVREFLKPKLNGLNEHSPQTLLPTPLPTSEAMQESHLAIPSSPQQSHLMAPVAKPEQVNAGVRIRCTVPANGQAVKIGRSSKSSKYALSPKNRLASRVHASVWFNSRTHTLSVECMGWNGLQICISSDTGRQTFDVSHNKIVHTDSTAVELLIHGDIVDLSVESQDSASQPRSADATDDEIWPAPKRAKLDVPKDSKSEVSESKLNAENAENVNAQTSAISAGSPVNLEVSNAHLLAQPAETAFSNQQTTETTNSSQNRADASTHLESLEHEEHKHRKREQPLTPSETKELENVATNYIAFSRLSAVPLQSVRKSNSNLQQLPKRQVKELIRRIKCIGVIEGSIEDATGRQADDEYYYIVEKDSDETRRSIVQSSKGHRSLRSCRKTHKQYLYRPLNLN